jgi:hypothetical protein
MGSHWLEEEERLAIEQSREEVQNALLGHDANILKRAVQALDRATESLAARMVEQAIDQASSGSP